MKKLLFTLLFAAVFGLSASAQNALREDIYFFKAAPSDIYGRFSNPAPTFVVFPDARTSKEEAGKFVEQTGLQALIDEYGGMIFFMNPVGEKYDNNKDFAEYEALINKIRVFMNLKVIGIGNGATFVNETVARRAGNVAGIVSIGGKASAKKAMPGESPVPAYIAGSNSSKVATSYIQRDGVKLESQKGKKLKYVNSDNYFTILIVNKDTKMDLKTVIADAWDELLSRNCRYSNYGHTWYIGESYCEHGDYELFEYVQFDRLGITRNVCTEDLTGAGKYLWYEYIPESVKTAAPGTVPLVVLLHGNNNDPRTQAETSGFLPVAAKEGFMVAEFEWQGNGWAAMGHDGIETVVYTLLKKYPQLDRSRVYAEGLSAGAFTATALGIKKTHVFAAVGAQSGGVMPALRFGSSKETLFDEALVKSDGCDMPYFSISGSADEVVPFPSLKLAEGRSASPELVEGNTIFLAWRAYQLLNNLPYSSTLDWTLDPWFGMSLSNRRRVPTVNNMYYEIGDQCKDGTPLMRIVVVDGYGHWNFAPGAQLMWDYFKMFSRDPETKKLIYHKEHGAYTVDQIASDVWHIQDYNSTNPRGTSVKPDGTPNVNNCSDMYIVNGRDKSLLIDLSSKITWTDTAVEDLRAIFSEIAGERERLITITHNHYDHTGMLPAFAEDENIRFLLPINDFADDTLFPAERKSLIAGGDRIDLGGNALRCVQVEGHTPGSMVFFLEGRDLAFSGDALGSGSGVWLFSVDGFRQYCDGVNRLVDFVRDPKNGINPQNLLFLSGHTWQRPATIPPLGMQYLLDMQTLNSQILAGTATSEPYPNMGRMDINFRFGTATVTWNKAQYESLRQ